MRWRGVCATLAAAFMRRRGVCATLAADFMRRRGVCAVQMQILCVGVVCALPRRSNNADCPNCANSPNCAGVVCALPRRSKHADFMRRRGVCATLAAAFMRRRGVCATLAADFMHRRGVCAVQMQILCAGAWIRATLVFYNRVLYV